jgi:hypothetical protein
LIPRTFSSLQLSNQQQDESPTKSAAAADTADTVNTTTTTENGPDSITNKNNRPTNNNSTTTCRFLIQNLKRGTGVGGFAMSDYHVDLVIGQHGLFDLIVQVFDILRSPAEKLTSDSYYSHLWDFDFAGVPYTYGWRAHDKNEIRNSSSESTFNGKHHIDEETIHPLDKLPTPLAVGQKGSIGGRSSSFDVTLVKLVVVDDKDSGYTSAASAGREKEFIQRWAAVSVPFSSDLADADWISETCKRDVSRLRQEWAHYMGGLRVWKYKRPWDRRDEDDDDLDIDDDGYSTTSPSPSPRRGHLASLNSWVSCFKLDVNSKSHGIMS